MANQHRGSVENYSDWHGYMQNTTMMEQSLHDDPSLFLMQPSEPSFRKYSMDAAPISLACKILDGKNRLTPSYSNPDLSSARRMGSLDGRLRHPAESSQRTCSLFGYNNTYPSFQSPLLVSHMKPPSSPTSRKNSMTNRRNNSIASTVSQQEQDRFATLRLEDVMDEIYPLCKDQYGCRFFQKKLEEQNSEQRDIIFNNVFPHFIELMTGTDNFFFFFQYIQLNILTIII
jgi:hypothetical protein